MDKSFFESKTIHFNTWSGLLIYAIWPFLPVQFRYHDWAVPAMTAWLTIGNVILRGATNGAIYFWKKAKTKS